MLRRFFFPQAQSPRPNLRLANQLPVFNNADIVATIIDNITDLPTLYNFACVFPVAGLVFAQYPRSILAHTVSDDLILAFVASTEYKNQGQSPIEPFLKQIINGGCSRVPRLSNGSQALETLLVIDDAIETFSTFLRTSELRYTDIKPGLVNYLWSLIWSSFYIFPWRSHIDRYRVKEALWHLEIYNALFLTGGSAAYKSSPKHLTDQAHYLHRLDHYLFWTLNSICTHFRQTLNSPSLHDTQHRVYEILKLGHGLTRSQRQPSKAFFEKHLAYQLSLALPEMLRVFHHQWSGYLRGPVPNAPIDGTDRRSPREVFQQRREEWTLLWGPDAYEELDEDGEAEFVSTGISKELADWLEVVFVVVEWVPVFWLIWFMLPH